jgi:threonine/homoserine/homoserine lactone efflux protein
LTATPRQLTVPRAWVTGLGVVLTNPKAALMWAGVSLYTAGMGMSHPQFLALGIGVAASAMTVYGAYALIFSTGGATRLHGRFAPVLQAAFGALFGALGLRLMYDGARALR